MTNEAIEKIRKQICNEKGVQRYCRDNCMHGIEHCAYSMAIQALEEIQPYRAIGTIEEFKALKEKSVAKKPYILPINREEDFTYCPNCKTNGVLVTPSYVYCTKCGQKLDWSE